MSPRKTKTTLTGQAAIEHGWRTTNVNLAESVRAIGLHAGSETFISELFPHHDRYVLEGMRVTVDRCEDVITVMQAVLEYLRANRCTHCGQTIPGGDVSC